MSKFKHIAAFTEGGQAFYPAYISINLEDDVYVIRARQRGCMDGIKLEIPEFDLARLCRQIEANVDGVYDITKELNAEIDSTIENRECDLEMLQKQYGAGAGE